MRLRLSDIPAVAILAVSLLSACGGGGSSPGTSGPPAGPTAGPTTKPTTVPTVKPSGAPTGSPTAGPTGSPTVAPTGKPTVAPTGKPTVPPTVAPTVPPTVAPTVKPTVAPTSGPTGTIQHVVVVIQENRTVDNLFQGFPNANTQSFGLSAVPGGPPTTIPLQMVPLAEACDLDHGHTSWAGDWDNGNMDGFSAPAARVTCPRGVTAPPHYAYSYVNPGDVVPYWSMARTYTLMDNVFEDPTSPSFQSHQHLIAGQSNNTSENPQINGVVQSVWGCDSPVGTLVDLYNGQGDTKPGIFPCFSPPYATVADLLDAKGLTWKYYAPAIGSSGSIWSAFDAVSRIRNGPEWANVIAPQTRILTEAANIPSVTYVVPSFADSDHASSNSGSGPAWVASVVNAIGTSPNWKNTAIFVVWDDWGGWYDHVAPPVSQNFTIGGFRVPVLCISPYSEQTNPAAPTVDHTSHGTDGILTFIEQTFNLGSLNAQDAKETPFDDCFNFAGGPKAFVPIPSSAFYPKSYFLREHASSTAPDND